MDSMHLGFGIVLLLGGLALSVFLGISLYTDPKKKAQTAQNPALASKGTETA
jgi:hypothetical protein